MLRGILPARPWASPSDSLPSRQLSGCEANPPGNSLCLPTGARIDFEATGYSDKEGTSVFEDAVKHFC